MDSDNKKRAKNVDYKLKFAKEKYKRIPLDLPLEMAEKWKKAAKMAGIPLNTFIKSAVNEKIENFEKNVDLPVDSEKKELSAEDKALLDSLSD